MSDFQKCPFCAEEVKISAKKCKHCKQIIDVSMRIAEEAINANTYDQTVYMNSGGGASSSLTTGNNFPTKNRFIAAILAFFFGWLGVHKFYLGEYGWGILYFLFFWTGIPLLVGILECFIYIFTSDQRFALKYG